MSNSVTCFKIDAPPADSQRTDLVVTPIDPSRNDRLETDRKLAGLASDNPDLARSLLRLSIDTDPADAVERLCAWIGVWRHRLGQQQALSDSERWNTAREMDEVRQALLLERRS